MHTGRSAHTHHIGRTDSRFYPDLVALFRALFRILRIPFARMRRARDHRRRTCGGVVPTRGVSYLTLVCVAHPFPIVVVVIVVVPVVAHDLGLGSLLYILNRRPFLPIPAHKLEKVKK